MAGMAEILAALQRDVDETFGRLTRARELVNQRESEHAWAKEGEDHARSIRDRNRDRPDLEAQFDEARTEQLNARDRLRAAQQEENNCQRDYDHAVRTLNAHPAR